MLRRGARRIAGIDEVGRGAIAGPVTVGVAVVGADTPTAPLGLRDSKLLSPQQREDLEPRVRRWALDCAVGHADAAEIDRWGIMAALRLAALRALSACGPVDAVILDGSYNWLGAETPGLFPSAPWPDVDVPAVTTQVKGDQRCSSVAAASVAAKVERDRLMSRLHESAPQYGWAQNKGYSTADHGDALLRHGLSQQHRSSWRLAAAEAGNTVPRAPGAVTLHR